MGTRRLLSGWWVTRATSLSGSELAGENFLLWSRPRAEEFLFSSFRTGAQVLPQVLWLTCSFSASGNGSLFPWLMSHLRNFHWLIVAAHGDRVTVIMESAPWWIGCIMQPDQPMELERGWHGGVSAHTGSAALPTVQPKVGAPLTQPAGGAAQSPNGAPSTAQSPSVAPVLRAQTPSAAAAQTPVATPAATGTNPANKTRAPRTAQPKPPPIM